MYLFRKLCVCVFLTLCCLADIDQWNKVCQVLGTPPREFFKQLQPSVSPTLCIISLSGGLQVELFCHVFIHTGCIANLYAILLD